MVVAICKKECKSNVIYNLDDVPVTHIAHLIKWIVIQFVHNLWDAERARIDNVWSIDLVLIQDK